MSTLIVERKTQKEGGIVSPSIAITPALDENYWSYRVVLRPDQAVVAFPKFFTIGIGFAVEDDWNTNLPFSCDAREIADHIGHNRGGESITDAEIIEAIELIQAAIAADNNEAVAS